MHGAPFQRRFTAHGAKEDVLRVPVADTHIHVKQDTFGVLHRKHDTYADPFVPLRPPVTNALALSAPNPVRRAGGQQRPVGRAAQLHGAAGAGWG